MVAVINNTVDMTDMIICDENIRLLVAKARKKNDPLEPEIGQDVVLTAAVVAGDVEIQVEDLEENIKAGTVLDFQDDTGAFVGSVTVAVPPKRGAKTIAITAAAAGIAAYLVAQTYGIEQVLTLANPVTAGDRVLEVGALEDWIEKGRILLFDNGVEVIVKNRVEIGETEISIAPAEYDIPAGEESTLYNYAEVCSINQVDDSSSANTLNERNYKSGSGTGKAVTSYNDTVSIGGNYIKGDFALFRLYNNKQDPKLRGYITHAIISEPEGGQDLRGKMWLGQHGAQRPNDQTKKISATLEVDGILGNTLIPRRIFEG